MTDTPTPTGTSADAPQETANLIRESFNLIHGDSVAAEEEGHSVEALTESFETYVEDHFATLAQNGQKSVAALEADVTAWAEETAKYQDQLHSHAHAAASHPPAKAKKGGGAKPAAGA